MLIIDKSYILTALSTEKALEGVMAEEINETTSDIEVSDPMVGRQIEGKYRVDRLLGQGGMGKVFKVTHLKLSKTFALKLMHPAQVTANPANLVRFEREAEALARITHPNVVMVTDFGVISEQAPYIVMEYIEGITLRKLLKTDGQLSERQAINITKQICAGLHEAHRQGIVHRDLKPENIMIQIFDDGERMARVLDFGIAVMKESSSPTLTEDWSMGTLKYMSPEQMYGVPLDARSDIFTICLMLYEMLTGVVPIVMMGKVVHLCDLRPSITPTLGEIIHRGMTVETEARQRSVLELKRELETVEQETMFQGASEFAPKPQNRQNVSFPKPVNVPVPQSSIPPIQGSPIISASPVNPANAINATNPTTSPFAPPVISPSPSPFAPPVVPPTASSAPPPVALPFASPAPAQPPTATPAPTNLLKAQRPTGELDALYTNQHLESSNVTRANPQRTSGANLIPAALLALPQAEVKQIEIEANIDIRKATKPLEIPVSLSEEFSLDLTENSQQVSQADENTTSVVDARLIEAVKSLALRSDFDLFLAGMRAPLIIASSLISEVSQGPTHVAKLVMNFAVQVKQVPLLELLTSSRNKVFDIFFYQVVNFKNIYSFFPAFEEALINFCPFTEQEKLREIFQRFKWQDIRPIGSFRSQNQEKFIAEKRKEAVVQVDQFNEGVYKNITHNVLSSEKRYNFKDPKIGEKVKECQTKVKNILANFVDLIKDKKIKKEILLANESDRYNDYENKETFKRETYLTQLADLAVSLFNDNFLYQSVQVFHVIRDLAINWQLDLYQIASFQEKGQFFNTQNIEAYVSSEQDRILVRDTMALFACWHPQYLLGDIQVAEDRRARRTILRMIECYGKDIYRTLLDELATNARTQPWYYARNLAALLGKIVCDDQATKNEAIALLDGYWQKNTQRQLIYQIITTLSFIGGDFACERLIARFKQVEAEKNSKATDLCQKLVLALIDIELDKGLEIVVDFYQKTGELKQLAERFSKIPIGNYLVQSIAAKIWKEIQRQKYSFSLFGDTETTIDLLNLVACMKSDAVTQLCKEIVEKVSKKNPLVAQAEKILNSQQPTIFYANERMLQRFALGKNLPKAVCYIVDSGISCRLLVTTQDGVTGQIDFHKGNVWKANVASYQLTGEDAFYWCFLLEIAEIEYIYVQPAQRPTLMENNELDTYRLVSNGLLRRGEITQIGSNYIQPNSRFRQRPVNIVYTSFEQLTDEPKKYRAVWNVLTQDKTLHDIRKATKLSKHEIYKILLYFFKHKMLIIDGHKDEHKELYIEDGFVMLELNIKRIERRDIMFNYYKTSGEICADLMRETQDQVLLYVLDVMRRFYLEHYENRRVLTPNDLKACLHSVELSVNYVKNPAAEEQNLLVSYIQNNFEIKEVVSKYEEAFVNDPALRTGAVEKIENIEVNNDPLDVQEDKAISLDTNATIQTINLLLDQEIERSPDFSQEEIKAKFDTVVISCAKPLKDFIRELYRNWKANKPLSVSWINLVEPALIMLINAAEKLNYFQMKSFLVELQLIINSQRTRSMTFREASFDPEISQQIALTYLKLSELQPKTFALIVSESDLAGRKEILLVKFILKQITEIDAKMINKFLFAGWNKFDNFAQATPDEIMRLVSIPKNLAEQVCVKFYQYRNIYYRDVPDYESRFLSMFELNLQLLKEMHTDVEQAVVQEEAGIEGAKERKEYLKPERQRMLWSLFILLAIKEEYDLIQMIQQSVFDMRIKLFEDYLAKLISNKSLPEPTAN